MGAGLAIPLPLSYKFNNIDLQAAGSNDPAAFCYAEREVSRGRSICREGVFKGIPMVHARHQKSA